MEKIRIIGLDGGTFAVIDYLVAAGRMPAFARAMRSGSRATLMSTAPPVTWPAWAAFYTGTNPGKNGAADLFKFRPGTYRLEPMNAGNLNGTPIWSLASAAGKRTCVYNIPVTYPARKVNGILISGLDAPSFNDQAIYPLGQKEKLFSAVPDFQINFQNDARYLVNHHPDPVREWIRQAKAYLDMEFRTIDYLMQIEDWDLFACVIRSTDVFQHTLWLDAERVMAGAEVTEEQRLRAEGLFDCYESIDRRMEAAGWLEDHNVLIMSDHGFGELRGHVCVNRVLADAGLLAFHQHSANTRARSYLTRRIASRLPRRYRMKIKKFLGRGGTDGQWRSYVDVLVADIDWSRTKICAIGGFGCMFVNLKGRDPQGTVAEGAEREAVLAQAEAALAAIRDPHDGESLVTGFYRKEELFSGPLTAEMPDLVVNMRDWSYCPVIGTGRELAEEAIIRPPIAEWKQLAHSGTHRREGILLMHGPDIASADIGIAQMVDIAPTVINLMGLPPLAEWDGRVLEEALSGGAAREVEPGQESSAEAEQRSRVYSDEDEEEVRKRLEDLGYL